MVAQAHAEIESIDHISDEMRTVVEGLSPALVYKVPPKQQHRSKGGKHAKTVFGHLRHIYISIRELPGNPATAMTLGAPSAMRAAMVDIAVTYRAHCRPGRVHHRSWPYDGCAQGYVSPSYYHYYRRGRPSGSSPNNISKSGSTGGHGGGHK